MLIEFGSAKGRPEIPCPTLCDTDKLTFSASIRSFPLLAYADILTENDGYSILFHKGVASCMYDLRADS